MTPLRTLLVLTGIAGAGLIDYVTGAEIRVYPLYYFPIALGAWEGGKRASLVLALLCVATWAGSNWVGGMVFSSPAVWGFNIAMQGAAFAFVGLLLSIVRQKMRREQELSRTDELTGLFNSRAFVELTERELARASRASAPLTLAYLDLDNFKLVNDQLGHLEGDRLLQTVGRVLKEQLRANDIVARLGGDEFAILLGDAPAEHARLALERVHNALVSAVSEVHARAGVSLGAAYFVTAPPDTHTLIKRADALMYDVKQQGKGRVQFAVV